MKILVLDNYDSFVYNLVYILKELGNDVDVFRNDKIALEEVKKYDKILLSPGPGIPEEAGIMLDIIREYAPTKPIFGVCLGHQAIGEAFGAKLHNMGDVLHGVEVPHPRARATPATLAESPSGHIVSGLGGGADWLLAHGPRRDRPRPC